MALIPAQLHAFYVVTTEGSVHGAARALRLTQTAVTRRLLSLESELGSSLFIRSRRGMDLTESGQSLLAYCKQVMELEGEVLACIKGTSFGAPAHVRVYGASSVLRSRIIPAAQQALASFAQVTLEFMLSDTDSGAAALKRGLGPFFAKYILGRQS